MRNVQLHITGEDEEPLAVGGVTNAKARGWLSRYVTAWNNLGNAYEKVKKPELALEAYEETLSYDAGNDIAKQRASMLRTRLQRLGKL